MVKIFSQGSVSSGYYIHEASRFDSHRGAHAFNSSLDRRQTITDLQQRMTERGDFRL